MIERKPPRAPKLSLKSVRPAVELFPHFREHIPLTGPVTAAAVAQISVATGLKERQIRELAKRYQAKPIPESLAHKPKGPKPGSHRFAPDIMAAIGELTHAILLKMPPPKSAEAARQIWGLLCADDGDYRFPEDAVPSERHIGRMFDEISEPQMAKSTMGSKSRTAHEPHPGDYVSQGFLDLVQMDHTKGDGILVDGIDREELGRPWITFLIEVWSRCILGWYVSFGDPSIYRCGRAVANAVLPKEPLLHKLGLDIDYPMQGLFKRLHADQAKPHRSTAFRTACVRNGIDSDVRKPGSPHLGGHIERLIGTMMGKMRLLPGATGSNVTERDGYDSGKAAVMTLPEFERWLLLQIAIYHNHPHSALGGLCPAQVWEREVQKRGPLVPVQLDPDQLSRQFLPSKPLTVHSNGIRIRHRRYWHDKLKTRIGQKVEIGIDEQTIQHVFAEIDGRHEQLHVIGQYPEVSVHEWEAARKQLRDQGRDFQKDGARAQTARLIYAAHKEMLEASARTKEAKARRKRREKEGSSLADLQGSPKAEPKPINWVPVSLLSEDSWLRERP